jgi:hypothetical protein
MPSMRPNRSLSAKNHRPFKVLAVTEKYAVVLALPDCYKEVLSVFYFWLLHMNSCQIQRRTTLWETTLSQGVRYKEEPGGS